MLLNELLLNERKHKHSFDLEKKRYPRGIELNKKYKKMARGFQLLAVTSNQTLQNVINYKISSS